MGRYRTVAAAGNPGSLLGTADVESAGPSAAWVHPRLGKYEAGLAKRTLS